MILERLSPHANWFAGLEVALTRPPGVSERRSGEDPWSPDPAAERPRRIADDLAWFRYAMDRPADHGLVELDEALPSTWDAVDDVAVERLQRLRTRGVLEATGFALHEPDLPPVD
jgi:hypothetical protein